MRIAILIASSLLLNACAVAPSWSATSGGAYSEYKVLSAAKTGLDLSLSANDLPTTNDYALSQITGYDCRVKRGITKGIEYMCKSVVATPIIPKKKPKELDKPDNK